MQLHAAANFCNCNLVIGEIKCRQGNVRNSRDPDKDYGETTDFSWGPGLVPRGYETTRQAWAASIAALARLLSEHTAQISACVFVLVVSRRGRRPDGSPNGYPGERAGEPTADTANGLWSGSGLMNGSSNLAGLFGGEDIGRIKGDDLADRVVVFPDILADQASRSS